MAHENWGKLEFLVRGVFDSVADALIAKGSSEGEVERLMNARYAAASSEPDTLWSAELRRVLASAGMERGDLEFAAEKREGQIHVGLRPSARGRLEAAWGPK